MSRPLQTYYEATKYLGQYVGKEVQFLHDTSCMDMRIRQALAGIDAAIQMLDDKEEIKELKQVKKILEPFGFALWPRDTVTDMALRHIKTETKESWGNGDDTTNLQDTSKDADSSQ